jgi:diguanylate cyclase (GGDEF)-like protein
MEDKNPVFVDFLTSLPNRYFLFDSFPKFSEEANSVGAQLCVIMLDVDNFKHINDTYGHLKGDNVLKEVAVLLRECVRGDDTVTRYAGDEFVILSRIADEGQIRPICNRITEKVSNNIFKGSPGEPDLKITVSGGFSICPRDSRKLEELLDNADKALYFSKERGKNRFSDFKEVSLGIISYKEAIKALSHPRFIDRVNQINKLKEIWNSALSNRLIFVVVKGKRGIGKTRLLDEFQMFINSQAALTLKTACSRQHIIEPYHSLSKAIEEYLLKNPDCINISSFLSEQEMAALMELIPQLKPLCQKEGGPEIKISQPQEQEQLRLNLLKSLRHILVKLSEAKGLLLYFDNIQWLDKATFELLSYFILAENRHKIMITGTLNEEEAVEEGLPSMDFLLQKQAHLTLVDLPAFSPEEVRDFVTGIFPKLNISEAFFKEIYNVTKGNCLFMQETLECLAEDGQILYKDNQWQLSKDENFNLPSSLEEVVQRRLRKIDPELKEILTSAAVMGGTIQLEVLREIVKKDKGHLFDLIDRAREKGVLGPQDKINEASFLNDYMQKALYENMGKEQKASLHVKTGDALKKLYKDNLGRAIGDLAYHSQFVGDQAKATEYKKSILKASLELFDPQEVTNYLERLGKELTLGKEAGIPLGIEIETIDTEISEEALNKGADLATAIITAVRNISLYPPASKMREESIAAVYKRLQGLFLEAASLTLSDLNKVLLLNSKRVPFREDKKEMIAAFISLMSERDIQSIQFLNELQQSEVSLLLSLLAEKPDEIRKKGGIAKLVSQEDIKYIKLRMIDYESLVGASPYTSSKIKERLTDALILDLVLGGAKESRMDPSALINQLKTLPDNLARELTEAAKSLAERSSSGAADGKPQAQFIAEGIKEIGEKILPGGWQAYKSDFAKLFSHLDKPVQSDLVSFAFTSPEQDIGPIKDMLTSFSDEEIIDIISSGYSKKKDKESFLYMKDLCDKLTEANPERKENIKPVLEDKLKSMGMSEAEISFVSKKDYKSLSPEEKKEMLFDLPSQVYSSIGTDNIKSLFDELIPANKYSEVKQVIEHLLEELGRPGPEGREESKEALYKILENFINAIPPSNYKFDEIVLKVFAKFKEMLKEEKDANYGFLIKDTETALKWLASSLSNSLWEERWSVYERVSCMRDIIFTLSDKSQEKDEISQLISGISESELLDTLIQQVKVSSPHNKIMEDIIVKFGSSSAKKLIWILIQEPDYSIEGYIFRKKITNILKQLGEPIVEQFKYFILSEHDPIKLRLIVEIIAEVGYAGLVESLKPLIKHKDTKVRREVVNALGSIGGKQADELLSEMGLDSDFAIAQSAKAAQSKK